MQKSILLIAAILLFSSYASTAQFRNKTKKMNHLKQEYLQVNDSLYFGKYEVSYYEYYSFLNDLNDSEHMDLYDKFKFDTTFTDVESYIFLQYKNYFINYPVKNIIYDAAIEYCKWKTNQYNNDLNRKYNKVLFRLPTETEWEDAASGGGSKYYTYPWGQPYLRGKDGRFLCNFYHIGPECITYDANSGKYIVITGNELQIMTSPINQYKPNNFGLYNMSGNVAEMVAEKGLAKGGGVRDPGYDVRIQSKKYYTKQSDDIGFRVVMVVLDATKRN